jgi:outer membrane lipoprotein-sorting protein
MTTIIEIQERGLKVNMNNDVTLIASYTDDKGLYFYNENLEKQYVSDTPTENKKTPIKGVKSNNDATRYSFEVEYEHNGRANGFALTSKAVYAKSRDEAIDKVKKSFKNIYEISEY